MIKILYVFCKILYSLPISLAVFDATLLSASFSLSLYTILFDSDFTHDTLLSVLRFLYSSSDQILFFNKSYSLINLSLNINSQEKESFLGFLTKFNSRILP